MKNLEEILVDISPISIAGSTDLAVTAIQSDSRQIEKGNVFVAVKGMQSDGHDYIEKAISKGAIVIIVENLPLKQSENITYIKVTDSAEALGKIASAFYDKPSSQFHLIGITGTNGKTSTATLLYRLFTLLNFKAALISTVENKIGKRTLPSTHTTPDAVSINELMAQMVEEACEYVFMEVSSHAIAQKRIAGLTFKGGIFSNLSHDHLDYHKTFKEYIYTKKKFFDQLPKEAFALTNIDDKQGEIMVQNTKAHIYRYSLRTLTDFKAKIIDNSLAGLHLKINDTDFYSRLIGDFNAYNLLAVFATARLLGLEKEEILIAMSQLTSAEGRFDYLIHPKEKMYGIIDYAHTPDALEKVLQTLQKLAQKNDKIITVIGCGGDRDTTKRPIMAKVAADYSHQVILTSDNPRSESPVQIIEEMEAGLDKEDLKKTLSITDRKQAIKTAVQLAGRGDFILVAGKGHEKYQEIKGIKHPFDDKALLKEIFENE